MWTSGRFDGNFALAVGTDLRRLNHGLFLFTNTHQFVNPLDQAEQNKRHNQEVDNGR